MLSLAERNAACKRENQISCRHKHCTYSVLNEGITMHKKMTITLDEEVYDGLWRTIGKRRMSQFIEDLLRPPRALKRYG